MIQLIDLRYGPGFIQEPGQRINLSPEEEQALIDAKRAVRVETAARPIAKSTNNQSPQKRGRK